MTIEQFLAELTTALVPVLATALTGLVGVGIAYLTALVKAKFGEQAASKTRFYFKALNDAVNNAVIGAQQSVVDRLKKEGNFGPDTQKQIKADVVASALKSLGEMQQEIQAQLKIDVPEYATNLAEKLLKDLKTEQE